MAHVQKVKAGGVGPIVGHYAREAERRGFERENIDGARTPLNYAVGAESPDALAERVRAVVEAAKAAHVRNSGKALRKDANVVCDWVVTLPKDCPEEMRERFFEAVVGFIQERYGKENVPGGFVHMDEATPHVHVPVVPLRGGKLQASKVVDRADLKTFHGQLGAAVDAALGMHVSIELDESQRAKKELSRLSQADYRAAVQEVEATQERLEGLRRDEAGLAREVEELQSSTEGFSESLRCLKNGRKARGREEVLRGEIEGLRERIRVSEGQVREQRARLEALDGLVAAARERLRHAVERAKALAVNVQFGFERRFGMRRGDAPTAADAAAAPQERRAETMTMGRGMGMGL